MSAEKKFDSLPKNVQKLVRKLAKVGREELVLMQDKTKRDATEEIGVLFEQEEKLISELFKTRFALATVGICYPEDFVSIDLEGMGEYLLGLYALDRLYAEEESKEYSEDLFYAGALLKRKAEWAAEMEAEIGYDPEDEYLDIDPDKILDQLIETFGEKTAEEEKKKKSTEGKVIHLFGENKNRLQ